MIFERQNSRNNGIKAPENDENLRRKFFLFTALGKACQL